VEIPGGAENIGRGNPLFLRESLGGPLAQTTDAGDEAARPSTRRKIDRGGGVGFENAKEPICGIQAIDEIAARGNRPTKQQASFP